jgi:arylsulfatase
MVAAAMLASGAQAQTARTLLPAPTAPFTGTLAEYILDAKGTTPSPLGAPQAAPNVFLVMSDDFGFALSSAFDGPEIRGEWTLPQGAGRLTMRFAVEKPGGPATVALSVDGSEPARVQLPTSVLMAAGNGESLDSGRDLGVTVTD